MIWAALGVLFTVTSVLGIGYSIYDVISTGAWRNWGILDWLTNIGLIAIAGYLHLPLLRQGAAAATVARGTILGKLENIPLLGRVVSLIWGIYTGLRVFVGYTLAPLFAEGGFFYRWGTVLRTFGNFIKRPWVLAGLFFLSSVTDGILSHLYQLWGDFSLKAASVAYDRIGAIMSEGGYGNPIQSAVEIIRGSKSVLPPCVIQIWQLVGAGECWGMIMMTFQYLFLFSALTKGYRLYERYGGNT